MEKQGETAVSNEYMENLSSIYQSAVGNGVLRNRDLLLQLSIMVEQFPEGGKILPEVFKFEHDFKNKEVECTYIPRNKLKRFSKNNMKAKDFCVVVLYPNTLSSVLDENNDIKKHFLKKPGFKNEEAYFWSVKVL